MFAPGPAAGLAPGGLHARAISAKRQMGAGQLSVLSCTAGSTGCGARSVHRLNVTSGTAVHTCHGDAALTHEVDSQSPGGDAFGTGPS